ncbi:hypothetical protein M8J75_001267 [Diaphorina citri]|nr:hypothetical protein M8J75_001267 [Diaphorina citri]
MPKDTNGNQIVNDDTDTIEDSDRYNSEYSRLRRLTLQYDVRTVSVYQVDYFHQKYIHGIRHKPGCNTYECTHHVLGYKDNQTHHTDI